MTVRHRVPAVVVATAAALLLAACGGTPATQAPAPAAAAETRTIPGQYGDTTVTGVPEIVVAPDNPGSDIALELGVPLAAQGEWGYVPDGIPAWRRPLIQGPVPPVIRYNPDGYDVEETLGFEPDLVIGGFDLEQTVYEQLSAVVPVLSPSFTEDPDRTVLGIGRALGREEQARELLDRQQRDLEAVAARYPQVAGTTLAVASSQEGAQLLNGGASLVENFWAGDIGFVASPTLAGMEEFAPVGAEQFALFDADLLVVSYASEEQQRTIESMELFQAIPAVAQGRYLGTSKPDDFEYLRATSPAHVRYATEHFLPRLADLVG